jgi:hypothetical protein
LCRSFIVAGCVLGLLAFTSAAKAGHTTDPRTSNLQPLGHILEPAVLGGFGGANPDINTDIAFQGRYAYQGNWDGFSIRDISSPNNPRTVSRTFCDGNQGDVTVYGDVLVRSWNSPAGVGAAPFGTGLTCDGQPVTPGFEGLHVFDISDLGNPELVATVPLACGSHTSTAVPDVANNRLLVYSSPSAHSATNPNPPATCDWFDVVEVPLAAPETASLLRTEPAEHTCHDIGVILGDAMRAVCAGGEGFRVFSLGGDEGGTLVNPDLMHHVTVPTVTIGHSAVFSWDGDVIVFGHEPGGGVVAECEETDSAEKKSYFFYDTETGDELGRWTLPRPQGATENCTLHNPNTIPIRTGRDIVVLGAYQAGTWVVDFTDPANPFTLAWSDPPPKPKPPLTPFCCDVTGSWSSFWYDGQIYESNIGEGLNIFTLRNLTGRGVGTITLGHLNPNTQEFSLEK